MARSGGFSIGLLVLTAVLAVAGPARGADTCFTDTSVADFGTGGSCYVAQTADGEVILAPTAGSEFSGSGLPAGWNFFTWDGSGTQVVSGGSVTVNGAIVRTDASFGPNRSLEFVATFTAGAFQHVGFGNISDVDDGNQIFNSLPWAIFSTKNDGAQVRARIWSSDRGMVDFDFGFACTDGTCLGSPHLYRIDWTATGIDFSIDGSAFHHEDAVIAGNMRPAVSDAVSDGAALSVDWLRMTPYGATCQFQSRIFDGLNAGADWSTLTASLGLPSGTTATIETRTGNTSSPDGTWSAFAPLSGSTIASPTARYLQYQVTLSTSDLGQTPELADAQVCYTACTSVPETCNGLDDDCDGQVDQTFDLGQACTVGVGDCEASGVKVCSPNHTGTVCNATPGTPHAETCDNHDNDCDGQIDEDDPGGNVSCSTGHPGICSAGLTHCQNGGIVCAQQNQPTAETCNGLDDNCNGQVDELDPGGGVTCNTGLLGVCSAGIKHCQGGTLMCMQQNQPAAETCNDLDDDCDGTVDNGNPGGGGACTTGQLGECGAGTMQCQAGGHLMCVRNTGPTTEICNGVDDDCDGQTDEGNPGGGAACTTGQPGVCGPGTQQCLGGHLSCARNTGPSTEICNGVDDDCDGVVDDGDPGGGASCTTGMPGVCGPGTKHCSNGNVVCQANLSSTPETCNNLDDNCNGQIDEGNPGGGGACSTGEQGVCDAGTLQCQSGAFACVRTTGPSTELCNSGADEDCDGQTDEVADCVLCQPASTVTSAFQTKKTKVRLRSVPATDKVQTQGTFLLPASGTIAPDTQDVRLRLTDNLGFYYQATIPAGSFVSSGNGRNFKFTDKTGAHDGILSAKFSIKTDGVTVKYTIKSGRLDQPAFNAGSGTATIQIGTRCFADSHDVCTVSGNGSSALCK